MLRAYPPALALVLCAMPHPCQAQQALRPAAIGAIPATMTTVASDLQDSLVTEARRTWHAHPTRALPGWAHVVRDVERRVGRPWNGPPAIVLLVPDAGRGFACDDALCLGRYLGARIELAAGDSSTTVTTSIILLAESMAMRQDVWEHELTHAVLSQHGLTDESARHDRRYFRSEHLLVHGN
jgi:hypothetical protein